MEALLRWTPPALGPVDPSAVIAVAEETGLIVPLGELVLHKALSALRELRQEGHDLPSVSVNTSPSQLATVGFSTTVLLALRHHDVDPSSSGYSSLSYLGQFAMQELKLDGTFINGLETEVGRSVLRGVVDIAHAIGARVVAEKVETRTQVMALRRLGCDVGQGFIFSQALPPERMGQWLTDRNRSTDLTWRATA